jgi:hypothetical protein
MLAQQPGQTRPPLESHLAKRKSEASTGSQSSSDFTPPPSHSRETEDEIHLFGSPNTSSYAKRARPGSMERQKSTEQITPRCESTITDTTILVTPDDIRRRLGLMMAVNNNEGDVEGYKQTVANHFLPDARYILKYIGKCPYGPDYLELDGIQAIIQFWSASFLAIPDSFMDIKEVKIRVLGNAHSSASYKYVYTGTQVLGMVSDESSTIIVSNPADTSGTGVLAFQVEGESRLVRDVAPDNKMLGGVRQARRIHCIGTMTLFFDENKKVYKVENVHTIWNK